MFYLIPTKRGFGADLEEDDPNVYSILSNFLYHIRHAHQGDDFCRDSSHLILEPIPYYGFQISWVQLLIFIALINYKKSKHPRNKLLDGVLLQIEYWTEEALSRYDKKTGKVMKSYVGNVLDGSNPYLYYYLRRINATFFELKGGKKAFHELPELMTWAMKGTPTYNSIKVEILEAAKKFKCQPSEVDINDDDSIYEIKW